MWICCFSCQFIIQFILKILESLHICLVLSNCVNILSFSWIFHWKVYSCQHGFLLTHFQMNTMLMQTNELMSRKHSDECFVVDLKFDSSLATHTPTHTYTHTHKPDKITFVSCFKGQWFMTVDDVIPLITVTKLFFQ